MSIEYPVIDRIKDDVVTVNGFLEERDAKIGALQQRIKELEAPPLPTKPPIVLPYNCLPKPARDSANAVYISGSTTGEKLPFKFDDIIKHVVRTADQFGYDLADVDHIILDIEHAYRKWHPAAVAACAAALIWDIKEWWLEEVSYVPSIGIWGAPGMGMTWQNEIEPDEIAEHIERDGQALAACDFLCPAQYLRSDMSLIRWRELTQRKLNLCKTIALLKPIYFCMCPFYEDNYSFGIGTWKNLGRFVLDNGADGISIWADRDNSRWPDDPAAFVKERITAWD